jgi:hypothetical protein
MGAKLVDVSFDLREAGLAAEAVWLAGECLEFAVVGGGGGGSVVGLF